jgi:hypothetical protein
MNVSLHRQYGDMESNPSLPHRLPDLSETMRLFLAGVRDTEIPNLEMLANLDATEREKLEFVVKRFTMEDLKIINESLENLRTMKRFGRFGMWLMGAVIAGASAAAAFKALFLTGGPK